MKNTKKYWLIAFTIVLILAFAACGGADSNQAEDTSDTFIQNFNPVVSATGKILPVEWATLSLPSGGIAVHLMVDENDEVKEGDVLLQLSGAERLGASLKGAELELVSAQQAYDDLFTYQGTNKAAAEQAVAQLLDVVRDAETRINNLKYTADQEDIDAAYADLILAEDRLVKARDFFEVYEDEAATSVKRAGALTAMNQAQNVYDSVLRTYNYMIGSADNLEIGKAEADLVLAQNQLVDAEKTLEQMADGPDPDILAVVEARLDFAKVQVDAAQRALDDLELKAPFSGTIGQINVRENEWVNPGQPLIVIGDVSTLQIETTDLSEIDVARVQIGSMASVTFDALPDLTIEATVVQIATKSSPGSGVNYTVTLEMIDAPENLLWDMTAYVDIEINDGE